MSVNKTGSVFSSAAQRCVLVAVLLPLLWIPIAAQQAPPSELANEATVPDSNTIVQAMEEAQRNNPGNSRAYTVTRQYKLFHNNDRQPVSETRAEVSFVPPDTRRYVIKQVSGNSRGQTVVRNILDLETHPAKNSSEITRRNYDFVFLQEENLGILPTYVLRMIPKRKQKDLLAGQVWVDEKTFRIERIEGVPAKKPSWLIKTLRITLQYGDLNASWLPTYMEATAAIRFLGNYVMIGRDVGLQASVSIAEKR
jgi:outer membrane lipoprotein-sorting protein